MLCRPLRLIPLASLLFVAIANAQPAGGPPQVADWNLTVGVAPLVAPVYQGADEYGVSLFPDLRVNYKDVFFASVPDGIGYSVINSANWKVGPLVKLRFGRQEDTGGSPFLLSGDPDGLRGMGDVDLAGEAGGFAQYSSGSLRTRVELRQGFGGHDGFVGDVGISHVGRTGRLSYSIGPRLSFGSRDYMHTYFGIDAVQSRNTGLARYDADGGIQSIGIGGSAVLPLTSASAMTLFAGYDRLGDPLRKSPLIRERGDANQFSIGLAWGYRIGLGD